MGGISVEINAVSGAIKKCQTIQAGLKSESTKMLHQYDSLGNGWNDEKYRELGQIVHKCSDALKQPLSELQRCEVVLTQLHAIISKYEGIHFNGVSSGEALSNSSQISESNNSNLSDGRDTSATSNFGSPHFYESTQESWRPGIGSNTYDSPHETGRTLNSNQGLSPAEGGEGVEGYRGTCGLVSCQNVLRMAGLTINESDVVNYARNTRTGFLGIRRLCTTNSTPANNGGTYASDRQQILQHFGVESTIESGTIDNIARNVAEGRGVIVSVEANRFWGRSSNLQEGHAVTITSVERDSQSGNPIGFYVCDSGTGESSRYVTATELQDSLFGSINVTTRVIR